VQVQANGSLGTYRIKYYDASTQKPQTAPSSVSRWILGYTIRWYPLAGAATYQVSRSSTEAGSYTDIGSPVPDDDRLSYNPYSFTDTSVSSGTYWYKVRAVNTHGDGPDSEALEVSPPTPLTTTWEAGEFTTYGQAWYSFDAAFGISYSLQWEDNSNSAYTGQVYVGAYLSDGTYLGSAWSGNSLSLPPVSSADTIYVQIQANEPLGTYRIKYDAVPQRC
jgi:hypothetical protein